MPHPPSVYAREGRLAGVYTGERCAKSAMAASDGAPGTWTSSPARSRRPASAAPCECAARSRGAPRRAGIRPVLGETADLPRARPLTEALEFFQGEAELAEDLVEEWRSDLSATMEGNRHGPAIGVVPALVASGLSTPHEADLTGHPLELPRGGARHSRFRSCPRAAGCHAPDTPGRSCRRRAPAPPRPLRAWASGRNSQRWRAPRRPTNHHLGDRARSCRHRGLGGSRRENTTARRLRSSSASDGKCRLKRLVPGGHGTGCSGCVRSGVHALELLVSLTGEVGELSVLCP